MVEVQQQQETKPSLGKYRILSIDGGGARSIIPAIILAEMEKELGALNEFFNMFSGTSTGALFTSALAFGKPASQLINFYSDPAIRGKIFTPIENQAAQKLMKTDVVAKYSSEGYQDIIN